MKKTLLILAACICTLAASAAKTFEWGTATWNITDGTVFEDIEDLKGQGVILTFPNEAKYSLTQFNPLAVAYNLYVDDAEEPVEMRAVAQSMGNGPVSVVFSADFLEGHKYKIVTTGAALCQVNIATFTTDTLTTDATPYTISFSIKGTEIVKTIDVEAKMSLYITNQEWLKTFSLIDVPSICEALGVETIDDCMVYGLNPNGSYNEYFSSMYDGWHDADGDYTTWYGGWDSGHGRNAYPCVYCMKFNEQMDSIFYYFYDDWSEYDPEAPDSISASGSGAAPRLAPETSYHKEVVDWVNEDSTITQYLRRWRCDEGKDYTASWAFVANKKLVQINATMHFISYDEYKAWYEGEDEPDAIAKHNSNAVISAIYSVSGVKCNELQPGVNIIRYSDGTSRKVFK